MARTHPDVPKPLVEVAGRSLLEIVLRRAFAAGASEAWLMLGHRAEEIRAHVRGLAGLPQDSISYFVEDDPLGTIGALHHLRSATRSLLVTNCDLLTGLDLGAMLEMHHQRLSDLTAATHDERMPLAYGEVLTDFEGNVLAYHEKPTKVFRVSSGINVVEPHVLGLLADRRHLDFPALVERAIEADLHLHEFFHDTAWIDVNDAADLARAQELAAADPRGLGCEPESSSP